MDRAQPRSTTIANCPCGSAHSALTAASRSLSSIESLVRSLCSVRSLRGGIDKEPSVHSRLVETKMHKAAHTASYILTASIRSLFSILTCSPSCFSLNIYIYIYISTLVVQIHSCLAKCLNKRLQKKNSCFLYDLLNNFPIYIFVQEFNLSLCLRRVVRSFMVLQIIIIKIFVELLNNNNRYTMITDNIRNLIIFSKN